MEEVGVLKERVRSHNNQATPQDKIHFKNFFFFCRRIGAPPGGKRQTLGQRLCNRATEPQRRLGKKAIPLIFLVFLRCLLCLWWLLCDTPNIPNGRARVGTTSAWKS